jgi:hypothetical protein
MILATCVIHDWKWGLYSPENYPPKNIYDTLAQILVGKSSDKRKLQNRMTLSQYKDIILNYIQNHIYIVKGRFSPSQLREKQLEMIETFGIKGFFKDPWNALNHNYSSLDSYLERELSEEIDLCTSRNIVSFITNHPQTPKDKKHVTFPSPYEITGGKIWYSKSYILMAAHREDIEDNENRIIDIRVQKVKEQSLVGIPNKIIPIKLTFNRYSNRYEETGTKKMISPFDTFYKTWESRNEIPIEF